VKCLGRPAWVPIGLEIESLVVGGPAECRVSDMSPGEQLIRVHNYSLMSYDIGFVSECLSTRLHYPDLMEAAPEGRVWRNTLTAPFGLEQGGRSASDDQKLAKIKDVASAADQNIAINLTAAARGSSGNYVMPEFMIQVDVAE
jgi:hypothetical protein